MSKVNWKAIPGFNDLYEISTNGDIRNTRTSKIRKYHITYNGYRRITLYKAKFEGVKNFLVHVLMREIHGDCEFKDRTRIKISSFVGASRR